MKKAVIIDTYPSGNREKNILIDCIQAYKDTDYLTIVATHYPLDLEDIEADYVIYDKNNEFLDAHYTPFFWMKNDSFTVEIYNAGHTLPICRNINNALSFCQSMGIEQFIFTEADVILTKQDMNKLFDLMNQMESESKKMLFFRPEEYRDCEGSYVYETLLFGGNAKYFLETFRPPMNLKEWLAIPMGYTLELSFYERFSHNEDKFLIVNDHSSNIFKDSAVNLLRYGLFNCELIYNEGNPENPMLFIMNCLVDNKRMVAHISINGKKESIILYKNQYWLNTYTKGDYRIYIDVEHEDFQEEYFLKKVFDMNTENELLKKKGIIKK